MPRAGGSSRRAPKLGLRPATLDDARFLFRLRNDPLTRVNSFRQDEIRFPDHVAWLEARLTDPESRVRLCIATIARPGEDAVRIGQVRFDCDRRLGRAEISISLAPAFRGRGLAAPLLRRALGRAPPFARRVLARIRVENAASLRAFLQADFRRHGGIRRLPAPHFVLLWRRASSPNLSKSPK